MPAERKYQIKEVTDKFGITRDTIYHYEKCGLVSMERSENGYRVFDELNVQKIKKILDLRDLGLSIDEIREFCSCESIEQRVDMMLELQKKTEEEIYKIKRRMERIRSQQRNLSESARFNVGFNVDYDLSFCVDCPRRTVEERRYFYIRDGFLIDAEADGTFQKVLSCEIAMKHFSAHSIYGQCGKKRDAFHYVFRGRVIYQNEEQFQKEIKEAYALGERMGYQLQQRFYATKVAPVIDGKECLTYNVFIPMDMQI